MKKAASFPLALLCGFCLTIMLSCEKLDVVGNYSVIAFEELLQKAPGLVSEDTANSAWSLSAPDNSVRFIWSKNFTQSPLNDVMLEMDASPFIAAGLDPSKLPGNFSFKDGKLTVGSNLGIGQTRYNGEITPLSSYQQIVRYKRSVIGYHEAMDHFGVNLGDGNLFEWAKNLSTNDKDIVFALDPGPFIRAGMDPDKIPGWIFSKVPSEDARGRMIETDKILKPFDL